MGLFKPFWQTNSILNAEKLQPILQKIDLITDKSLLEKISTEAQNPDIRERAFMRVDNQEVIDRVVLYGNSFTLRVAAIKKCTNTACLKRALLTPGMIDTLAKEIWDRLTELGELDNKLINQIASSDNVSYKLIREDAFERATDIDLIAKFWRHSEPSTTIRYLTEKKLVQRIEEITDRDLLIGLARNLGSSKKDLQRAIDQLKKLNLWSDSLSYLLPDDSPSVLTDRGGFLDDTVDDKPWWER